MGKPANPRHPKVHAIILAAGSSSRLGQPKQLVPFRGTTLLGYAIEQVITANFEDVSVVLGANYSQIASSIQSNEKISSGVNIVKNSDYTSGISSSIRCGVNAAPAHCDGAAIILCDQTALSTDHLNKLLVEFSRCPTTDGYSSRIAASSYEGSFGVPAIFGRKWFSSLMDLRGDQGAKKIIARETDNLIGVPFPKGGLDIDRPEDLSPETHSES